MSILPEYKGGPLHSPGRKYLEAPTGFTYAGTCWACEERGSDLVWWHAAIYEGGSLATNRRLGYLIHRECTKLAEAKIDADYQGRARHDGKLGGMANVSIREEFQDVMIVDFSRSSIPAILKPKQALSLLAWLLQEKLNLEEMARELKGGTDAH